MAKLSHNISAEIRLFAFYLSNGSFQDLCSDIMDYEIDYERILLEPSVLEQVFAIFANTLEVDENGKVLNSQHVYKRVAQYIRSLFDQNYVIKPPFESWEIELHL